MEHGSKWQKFQPRGADIALGEGWWILTTPIHANNGRGAQYREGKKQGEGAEQHRGAVLRHVGWSGTFEQRPKGSREADTWLFEGRALETEAMTSAKPRR